MRLPTFASPSFARSALVAALLPLSVMAQSPAPTGAASAPAAVLNAVSNALANAATSAGSAVSGAMAPGAVPVAAAPKLTISATQKSVAQQIAQSGVPLADLAPGAPEEYAVKSGDTLWGISGLFLTSPWRWPELWGMNLDDIKNPHRIFPGQKLYLETKDGMARLRSSRSAKAANDPSESLETVKVSPRNRYETLADNVLPTLDNRVIEAFLVEPLIVDETALTKTPRIVSTQEHRVLLSKGDRAYVLGDPATPVSDAKGEPREYRVFRNVTPLKHPDTKVVLGFEAQYVGKASLVRGQRMRELIGKDGKPTVDIEPGTIDIVRAKEEMRVGDRLLPEPPRDFHNYVPRAPEDRVEGRIVSIHGSAVVNAAQNQVVVINLGTRDGIQSGHVLALLKDGPRVLDRTSGKPQEIKLPDERNGLVMVFRPFETLSYGLILQITDGVKVGDRLSNPR
jgi:LysM domain